MIHLKHKENGFHIVYTEADAKSCEAKGWIRCDIKKEHEAARKEKKKLARDLLKASAPQSNPIVENESARNMMAK